MISLSLCDYSDASLLVKGTITVSNTAGDAAVNNTHKKVIFENCSPFTSCIIEINNTQVDNGEDNDIVMPMYNLIEYSDVYSKKSGSLWICYRDEPALDANTILLTFLLIAIIVIHSNLNSK